MCCFYSVMSPVVAFIDILNHLYNEDQLNEVSEPNIVIPYSDLNTFAN